MSNELIYEIKRLLKTYRLKSGLNYKECANLCELSEQTIRKYENSDFVSIPINNLLVLLKKLNVPLLDLLNILKINY